MYWVNKLSGVLLCLSLVLGVAASACADDGMPWVVNTVETASLKFSDGSAYPLKLFPDVEGVFYDNTKHVVNGASYVAVFQVSPSNPGKPMGPCGAGREVWLYVYKVNGAELATNIRVLVDSCFRSISLASQNTGAEKEDSNFSSVQWNNRGFSIQWFNNVDELGRSISSTSYRLGGDTFTPLHVLGK